MELKRAQTGNEDTHLEDEVLSAIRRRARNQKQDASASAGDIVDDVNKNSK